MCLVGYLFVKEKRKIGWAAEIRAREREVPFLPEDELNQQNEVPQNEVPPPPQHAGERITKELCVTTQGICFHNPGCVAIQGRFTRRLRGCNVCHP